MQRTQVIVTVLDDIDLADGQEVAATDHHTLTLDGREVVLDLSAVHSKELTEFLAPYIKAGHTTRYPAKPRPPMTDRGRRMSEARKVNNAAREWAVSIGREVPNRSTLAHDKLVEDYKNARSKGLTP